MKKVIEYHYIQSNNIFTTPKFHHKEIVDAKNEKDLHNYIISQKDEYGNNFKLDKSFGFDYISARGAIKVYDFIEQKVKKI